MVWASVMWWPPTVSMVVLRAQTMGVVGVGGGPGAGGLAPSWLMCSITRLRVMESVGASAVAA
ncbi:hypothetical protein B1K54_01385 [Streptomyces sp. fd1-xmd]|nr:hypothetical protein B1K54_01385 [Streptomyces sp. fd1-xmd]